MKLTVSVDEIIMQYVQNGDSFIGILSISHSFDSLATPFCLALK